MNGLIQVSEENKPKVFIVSSGAENGDGNPRIMDIVKDTHLAVICIWIDPPNQDNLDDCQFNTFCHSRIEDGILTANWMIKNANSPLTKVVLLFSSDFPTYRFEEEIKNASKNGVYCMVHKNNRLENDGCTDANSISTAIGANMSCDSGNVPAKVFSLEQGDVCRKKVRERNTGLLRAFQEAPPSTHNLKIEIYYTGHTMLELNSIY